MILSLVRNRGDPEDKQGGPKSIGFLKVSCGISDMLCHTGH